MILSFRLSVWMIDVNHHGNLGWEKTFSSGGIDVSSISLYTYHTRVGNKGCALSIELIRLENCVPVPVWPIHPVPKEGDAKRMFEHLRRRKDNPRKNKKKVWHLPRSSRNRKQTFFPQKKRPAAATLTITMAQWEWCRGQKDYYPSWPLAKLVFWASKNIFWICYSKK